MLTAMLAAFIGGIILNFMPCVFPVISLKALGLLRHADNAVGARREGLAFLLGVMVTMMLLAGVLLAARAGGVAVGWGFQLQSPLVIALLSLVILAAALNLLGVFEVGLSAQRVGALDIGRGAFLRSAMTGALAIVVATPCAAPFMASAIGYALVQPPATALVVFFALALGFSAPFTLVSLFPALASLLPRPGGWMDILKRALAFPMFGAYAWLVWVLAQQAGSSALATLLAASVVLSFAAWLYGIAQQRGHGKAIFVNFTASWCITCQVNEKTSLSTQAVKEALAKTGTLYMVADSTKFNPDVDALNQFGQGGLPLYVVYPADGGPPKVLPQLLTPGIVVNALNQATGKKA